MAIINIPTPQERNNSSASEAFHARLGGSAGSVSHVGGGPVSSLLSYSLMHEGSYIPHIPSGGNSPTSFARMFGT